MAKRVTANQQEYKRQLKRIKSALTRESKKGYDVSAIREEITSKPSRITKKYLEKLKSITPSYIRKQSPKIEQEPIKESVTPTEEIINKPQTNTELKQENAYTNNEFFGDVYDYSGDDTESYSEKIEENISNIEPESDGQKVEIPYADAIGYTRQYIEGTAKEVITLYDDNGDMIAEIARINGGEFIDTATGELFDRNEVKNITANLNQYNANLFKEANTPIYNTTDLSDYAIEMLYNQTQILSDKTGGVLHKMFDEVREELGDGDFYNMLLESNGFRSAFGELSSMLKSGADYMQAFARFGASIVNAFPLNQQQREAINEAFTELVQQADEGDINS